MHRTRTLVAMIACSAVGACSDSSSPPVEVGGSGAGVGGSTKGTTTGTRIGSGGALNVGGTQGSTTGGLTGLGGTRTAGGAMSSQIQAGAGAFSGGAPAAGGSLASGGTSATGSTAVTGGTAATGGSSAASGSSATGGASVTAGTSATGGNSPTGGTSTTGGASASGGSQALGGTRATGGNSASATGGTSAAGGTTSTGGASRTGGSQALGGTRATGGTSTASGGTSATGGSSSAGGTGPSTVESLDISDVWSGHPVGFALVTRNSQQFVAYYDAQRRMTVASRTLGGSTAWTYKVLPSTLGWDSHNYVAMALDSANQIHVSGNMHGVPLVYFKSATATDISTIATSTMVGTNEATVTYPIFFNGPTGALVFEYRDGSSGNGNTIFNTYSTSTRTWTRTLNTPLLDGSSSSMNAYPQGPVLGPDGYYHLVWVWRNTADASTNHDLSYAKTQDLVHWFKANGTAITLPITPATGDVVDPVPVNGGMINNNTRVGFDAQNRPIIAYHKFDNGTNGNTQLYFARFESGNWVIYQGTNWTYRWAFGGTGTLVFQISIDEGPKLLSDGRLVQNYSHAQYGGKGTLVLNPATLHAEQTLSPPLRPYLLSLDTPESTYRDPTNQDAMGVRWQSDSGSGPDPQVLYMLRWETLPSNKDQARANTPPATRLRVYGFRQ